ncbi:MAG: hypothetical protein QM489_00925 [Candidatus Izemoplasma sp.]
MNEQKEQPKYAIANIIMKENGFRLLAAVSMEQLQAKDPIVYSLVNPVAYAFSQGEDTKINAQFAPYVLAYSEVEVPMKAEHITSIFPADHETSQHYLNNAVKFYTPTSKKDSNPKKKKETKSNIILFRKPLVH